MSKEINYYYYYISHYDDNDSKALCALCNIRVQCICALCSLHCKGVQLVESSVILMTRVCCQI